ncbi:MAG: hypothetical protein V1933_08025 [Candidatus Omnitrophota bacterium]
MRNVREVSTKTLALGTPETFSIPRNYAHRHLALRLAGSITVAGGTTSGTPKTQGLWHLLSSLRIKRNGGDTVVSIPGWLLYELNKVFLGTAPTLVNLASGDAQSNTAVNGTIIIPFENLRGIKPFDTLLKGSGLSSLDLLVDTAAASAMINGGDRTVTAGTTAFTLNVTTVEETEVNNFVFGDIRTSLVHKVAITGASSNFQIKPLPTGNFYKAFMLFVEDAGAGSNSVINKIKLKSGSESFVDVNGLLLRDIYKQAYSLESLSTGVYYVDLMPDGMLNSCLDVTPQTGRETLELELDVAAPSGTCYVYVVGLEYIPPVGVRKS